MPKGVYKRKPRSEEHKKNISEALKGCKHTEQSRKNMSIASKKRIKKYPHTRPPKPFQKGHKGLAGKESPVWKGGITPENQKIRMSIEFSLWRKSVFERDNYSCQKYGIKGGRLHAHHIQNFAQFPELRFAIDNGITLSREAHREFHKIYGRKNNTQEQLLEFLNCEPIKK